MTKKEAFKKADSLGYTIKYHVLDDETRFRKPGAAVNSLNQPYEYAVVYKSGRSWQFEERVENLII